ncbi:hypothetical protein LTR10_024000 [Elasticomyces elasticus]|uniref:Apple domain-containing protein n=1 Tax=Exophiala sideris TaxID=1016849 RepID=A0ABR0IWC5_9EURO|nr:hypothetical protein LTR10_024000 [Elasticomyces elasticus]KAK5020968.1 hypothetical protein LTS07_011325 [Exophiala sideris]KAK5028111.1 hypothetical protein LTR13_009340 [Exophiala sideris]KAK5048460.1 hypothetical protein LTR69_011350 [Exophiala sideris]
MGWDRFAIIALAAQLVGPVYGYGTTVEVFVSYCPATYTTSVFGGASTTYASTSAISGAPSSPSSGSYFLAVDNGVNGPNEYVADDGTLTTNASLAVAFTIDPSGQLMASGGYISTTGAASTQKLAVNSTLGSISTFFSIVSNNTVGRRDDSPGSGILQWQNDNFVGNQAIFSTFGSIVQVSFNGEAPAGSEVVTLAAIPAGDIASSSGISVSTGSTSLPTSAPNSLTTTPNALSSGPSLPTTPSVGISGTASSLPMGSAPIYGSSTSAPISSTVSAYPTSTGPPSCNDRSPYDGTVNDNYLILCDTDLPGYDITSVPASDIADCIGACNAYVASSGGMCVAITFNSSTATDPCTLKAQVGAVDRGADAFVQAAIVVNEPYAPTVVFKRDNSIVHFDTELVCTRWNVFFCRADNNFHKPYHKQSGQHCIIVSATVECSHYDAPDVNNSCDDNGHFYVLDHYTFDNSTIQHLFINFEGFIQPLVNSIEFISYHHSQHNSNNITHNN